MTLVALVAGIAPFVNYLTLELPIFGRQEATLADSFNTAANVEQVDSSPIVKADFLNVRQVLGSSTPQWVRFCKERKLLSWDSKGDGSGSEPVKVTVGSTVVTCHHLSIR